MISKTIRQNSLPIKKKKKKSTCISQPKTSLPVTLSFGGECIGDGLVAGDA